MLAAATTAKLLAEIALLALAGQWVVGLLAGAERDTNPFYRVLQLLGRPWVRAARWISPPVVLERHLPLVAFLVLGWSGSWPPLRKFASAWKLGWRCANANEFAACAVPALHLPESAGLAVARLQASARRPCRSSRRCCGCGRPILTPWPAAPMSKRS
jgi:hypothetical protein